MPGLAASATPVAASRDGYVSNRRSSRVAQRRSDSTLDDVIEILNGLATTLMTVGGRIEEIFVLVGGEDDETDS